jgi:hypothetical protein
MGVDTILDRDSKSNTNRTNRIMEEGYTYHELHTKGEHEKYSKFQALSARLFLFVKNEAMKKKCLKSPNQEEEGTHGIGSHFTSMKGGQYRKEKWPLPQEASSGRYL